QMEKAEARLGIQRVRPFELYLRRGKKSLRLPLFRPEYLEAHLGRGRLYSSKEDGAGRLS
ncbi:hypothetical protein, partial [Candidatus Hakubella thermalkaliphila]